MNNVPSDNAETLPNEVRDAYRSAFRCGGVWAGALALWCSMVLDMGESMRAFICALIAYIVAVVLIRRRRLNNPSKVDLLFISFALPFLFLAILQLMAILNF